MNGHYLSWYITGLPAALIGMPIETVTDIAKSERSDVALILTVGSE